MSSTQNAQLHVKSYFAGSIQEAMENAQRELGSDALFLNSRPSPQEGRHLGAFEVVFGEYAEPAAPAPIAPPAADALSMEDLRRQMEDVRRLLARIALASPMPRSRQPLVEQALADAGIEPGLVSEIASAVAMRLNQSSILDISRPRKSQDWDPDSVVAETVRELSERLDVKAELGRITALVGPPGSGKTTALVKLAVAQGLSKGRPVRLITADTQRVGAADQLRTYASILSVPFQAVESVSALEMAVDSAPSNSLVLIDTPGLSPALIAESGASLASFISRRQDIDAHLVLTASARHADLEAAAQRYQMFAPSRLLFTRLDEITSFGAIFCEAARERRPISFFSIGQLIPEDLEPATKTRIVEPLVAHLPEVLKAAA